MRAQIQKPRALLFDKDGTLFDFARTWEAWAAAFLTRLANSEAEAAAVGAAIGFDLAHCQFRTDSIVIAGTPAEVCDALAPHFPDMSRASLLDTLNEEAARAPQLEAVPLSPLLGALRAGGYKLGVATNDAEGPARAHLSSAGVEEAFDFIAGFDSGHGAKPGPGQLLAFCDAVDVPSEACVMIGDSTHDLIAGRAAGMQCVAVLTGLANAETLAPLADVVLPDISALPDWLSRF
ncbi:MAG: HAD family hydrolase [Roseobacter sp.]